MKFRKLIASLTALTTIAAFSQSVSAERIKISNPEILSEDGTTTITYTLTEAPEGEGATLIAMYVDSENGNILSVNSERCEDVSLLTDGKLSISVPDKSNEGAVLKHYLWKDLSDVTWIKDFAPSTAKNVKAIPNNANPATKIDLLWNAADDDWDNSSDLKYNIYDMGLLVEENVSGTSYNAENLSWGTKFNFEVEAIDTSGNVSERSVGTDAQTIIPYSISTSDEIASTDSNLIFSSIPFVSAGDAGASTYYDYEEETVDNIPCVATSLRSGQGTFHSIRVSPGYASVLKAGTDVVFELEYWSDTNSQIYVQFYGTNNGTTADSTYRMPIKNNGKWNVMTQKVTLRNDFEIDGRKNHNYSHIRFRGGGDTATSAIPFYVRRITLIPLSEYEAMNPERAAYLDVQGGVIHNGLEFAQTPEIEKIDESYYVKAENLAVQTTSEVSAENATGIEVIYYAPEDVESFTINGTVVNVTKNGCPQKARVMLDGGLATSSFVIDGGVYVDSIKLLNGLPEL